MGGPYASQLSSPRQKIFCCLALALSITDDAAAFALRRGGLMAEYFALTLAASTAVCVLSYLCLASAGPLVDSRLMAMDRMLGFDWLAGYRFVHAHPAPGGSCWAWPMAAWFIRAFISACCWG